MRSRPWSLVLPILLAACQQPAATQERRAELKQVGPASVQVLSAAGQLPYCLMFTVSERGVVRQLTMTPERRAVPCKAGEPVGGVTYKIPPEEGKVRLHVLFSDEPIGADTVARQVHEVAASRRLLTAMDLRAPGQLRLETLEFTPGAAGGAPAEGPGGP